MDEKNDYIGKADLVMSERVSGVLLVLIGLCAIGADRTWVLTFGGLCVLALGGASERLRAIESRLTP